MHPTNIIKIVGDLVLDPSTKSVWPLFWLSLVNEVTGVFPLTIALGTELIFFKGVFSLTFFAKLLFFVAVPVGFGSALGSLLPYSISYWGGKPAIEKFQKVLRFSWSDVERANEKFTGVWYDELIFLFFRSLPLLPSLPVDIAAGIFRMKLGTYFVLTMVGFTIRIMLTFFLIGWGIHGLSHFAFLIYTRNI